MSSYQQVTLVGNLGNDVKLEATQGGTSVAMMSVATSERYKDREGNAKEETSWHRVKVYGRLAENCANYLAKGSKVLVIGRLRYSKSTGRDGTEKYFTDIIAGDVQFLDKRGEGGAASRPAQSDTRKPAQAPAAAPDPSTAPSFADDDIPF